MFSLGLGYDTLGLGEEAGGDYKRSRGDGRGGAGDGGGGNGWWPFLTAWEVLMVEKKPRASFRNWLS